METQTLHRGRLNDHIQLVVRDLAASQRFCRAMVDRFYQAALAHGGQDNGAPASAIITPVTSPPLCSIRTATISKRSIMARQYAVRSRWKFGFRK